MHIDTKDWEALLCDNVEESLAKLFKTNVSPKPPFARLPFQKSFERVTALHTIELRYTEINDDFP